MSKPTDVQRLDMLDEGELADLVACDEALRDALARRLAVMNTVKALEKRIAESVDLDVSAWRAEVDAAIATLTALPVEIGALKRRSVLLHLAALKVQRDRKREQASAIRVELDEVQGKLRGFLHEERALAVYPQHTPEERKQVEALQRPLHAGMQELKAPEKELYTAYYQADLLAKACDSWARDYGHDPRTWERQYQVSLDSPVNWGEVAGAQGKWAQKEAERRSRLRTVKKGRR